MQWKYALSDVDFGDEEAEAAAAVVRSKWLSQGPLTAKFEEEFAAALSVKHAVFVNNCTMALHLGLLAAGVGPGDEVLVPSYTFVASVNAILYAGGTPVFVDIVGPADLNLDVADLERKITPRTKAIVPVHFAGFPVDLDRLMALAAEHSLEVVEDACHSIGTTYLGAPESQWTGRKAGTIGTAGCFSFFANKNLATGEGGMLVTNHDRIAHHARLLRSHGMTKSSWDKAAGRATDYDVAQLGFNYRGTEITAAIGRVQLQKLAANNRRRKELAVAYRQALSTVPDITLPFWDRDEDSAHHIFPLVCGSRSQRDAVRESLHQQGVQTSVHYPPVHLFSHFRRLFPEVHLPQTESVAAREVTLPLHPLLSSADVSDIAQLVAAAIGQNRDLAVGHRSTVSNLSRDSS